MSRCRCGLFGSSGPGDDRVSYRSSPPGGKWVQWAGGKWETSPANEDVMDTDKKNNLNLRYCQWHQPSSSRPSKPLAFGSFLDKSSGLPSRTDPWWIEGLVRLGWSHVRTKLWYRINFVVCATDCTKRNEIIGYLSVCTFCTLSQYK